MIRNKKTAALVLCLAAIVTQSSSCDNGISSSSGAQTHPNQSQTVSDGVVVMMSHETAQAVEGVK